MSVGSHTASAVAASSVLLVLPKEMDGNLNSSVLQEELFLLHVICNLLTSKVLLYRLFWNWKRQIRHPSTSLVKNELFDMLTVFKYMMF